MALSAALEKFKESLSCVTGNGAQHTHIQIEEHDPLAALRKITLLAPMGDWVSFNPDDGRKCRRLDRKSNLVLMSPLLVRDDKHDHHCACDAVIVLNQGRELRILYIELKSGNPRGYAKQFISTRNFVRYAINLLNEFQQENFSIKEERYVVFCGGKKQLLNKKPTVSKLNKIRNTSTNNAYIRQVPDAANLHLKELLA